MILCRMEEARKDCRGERRVRACANDVVSRALRFGRVAPLAGHVSMSDRERFHGAETGTGRGNERRQRWPTGCPGLHGTERRNKLMNRKNNKSGREHNLKKRL